MPSPPRGPIGFRLAHELEGLLQGIAADGNVSDSEIARLRNWRIANHEFASIAPFDELSKHVDRALDDGVLTPEECEDLLFVVGKYTTVNPHFDAMRAGLQSLMGILAGVAADARINDDELQKLSDWHSDWSHLKGLWPYDECDAIVTSIRAGGHRPASVDHLFALAEQFPIAGSTELVSVPLVVKGVCAVDPSLEFRDKEFVFTGESHRATRDECAAMVITRGGIAHDNVRRTTDYLVVCDGGNPYWAFCCYGRKVERAYDMRRGGHPITIVHEVDFWDA